MFNPIAIPSNSTAEEACEWFRQAGWREIGMGDWAWAFGHPDSPWAARVMPFDPAYRMFAQACLDGPTNRWLPHVEAILPLRRDGYVTLLERLHPAPEDEAAAFCEALGIRNDSGYDIKGVPHPASLADPNFVALHKRILALIEAGARHYALWGGSDIRPGNIMADARGELKLVDPIFLRGLSILQAIEDERHDSLSDFSREQLEDFLTIPAFRPDHETDALREKVGRLFG